VEDLDDAVARARGGDPKAVADVVRLAYPQVWNLSVGMVGRDAADDVTQDALLRCIRSLPHFRGDSAARTWVLSIARRACVDELRARQRHSRRIAATADVGATTAPDASQPTVVRDLLERLDPDRRVAFVLTQLNRLTYAEAAQILGCPVGTIRSRVSRAREDLIVMLHGSDSDSGSDRRPASGDSPLE
jgi:RNA polymerase sigma-70 factor, ECF subfamily